MTKQPDRTPLEMIALAAWLNVRVDQIPPENRAHLNPYTMAAWKRVAEAVRGFEMTSSNADSLKDI